LGSDFGSLDQVAPLEGAASPTRRSPGATRPAPGGRPLWLPFALSLAGILAALAVALVLWLAPVDGEASRTSAQIAARTTELAVALQLPEGPARRATITEARSALDRLVSQLETRAGELPSVDAALPSLRSTWSRARPALDDPDHAALALEALRQQASLAEGMTASIEAARFSRHRSRNLALGVAALASAAIILWGALSMRRHRQHLRRTMRQFSDDLGSGSWQDAVRSLRNERSGPPSAWDALATGVESVLGESDRRWRALADLAADWYWETDTRHRLAWISGAAPPISAQGWSLQRVMGRRYDSIDFFEPPAAGWPAFRTTLDSHAPFRDIEFRILARDGDPPVWVSISGRPRLDMAGRFAGYEGVGRDITERQLANEQLRSSEQRWSAMAGLASDYYWETDAEHRMKPLRPELRRRFGDRSERLEGLTRWEAHPHALTAEQWADHRADLEAHRPFRGLQIEVEVSEGQFLWLSISGVPRVGPNKEFLGYHGVGRDITMRKQAERLLMRHNEELQRAVAERTRDLQTVNLELDAFARQLAHELRTPIGHVQGLAHLIEARAGSRLIDEDRQLLAMQVEAARRMRETVDALLQLARSAMQPMPVEAIELSELVRNVIDELPAVKRDAPVAWEVQDGMRLQAATAPMRIVLENLLSNAAKFTRRVAEPKVGVTLEPAPGGGVELTVRDNGAGFDMAQAGQLFKPFNRLHRGEEFQGTGIGLTIVQRIVERHGGQVVATGAPGAGASFRIRLPAPTQAAAAAGDIAGAPRPMSSRDSGTAN